MTWRDENYGRDEISSYEPSWEDRRRAREVEQERAGQELLKQKRLQQIHAEFDAMVTPLKEAKRLINNPARLYAEIQKNSEVLLDSYQKLTAISQNRNSREELKSLATKALEDYLEIHTYANLFTGSLEGPFECSWKTFAYFLQQPSCDPQRKLSQITFTITCKALKSEDSEALAIVFKHVTTIKLEDVNRETLKIIQTAYVKAGIDRTVKTVEVENFHLAADNLKPALVIIASILSEPATVNISFAFDSKNWVVNVGRKAINGQNETVALIEKAPLNDTLVDALVTLKDALKEFQQPTFPFNTVLSKNNYISSNQFKTTLPSLIGLCERSLVISNSSNDSYWIVKTDANKTRTLQFTDCAITPEIAKTCHSLQTTRPNLSITLENTEVNISEFASVLESLRGVNGKAMTITCNEDKPNIASVSKSYQNNSAVIFDSSMIQTQIMQAVLHGANDNCTTTMMVKFARGSFMRFSSTDQYERVTSIAIADSTIYESDTTEDKIKQRLRNFPKLDLLTISSLRFHGRAKQQLLVQAAQSPIRVLSLRDFNLEAADAIALGQSLAANFTLEVLLFEKNTGVTEEALTELAKAIKTNYTLKLVSADVAHPPMLKTILERNNNLDKLKAKHAAVVKYLDEFDDSTIYTSEQAEKTSGELYQTFIVLCELKNYYYLTDIQVAELNKRLKTCLGKFFEKLLTLKNAGATFSIANHLYEVIVRASRDAELERTAFRVMTNLSLQTTSAVEAEKTY